MNANALPGLRQLAHRYPALLCGLILANCWSAQVSAAEVAVHGFGTIGAAYVDEPDGWAYRRSLNEHVNDDAFREDLDTVVGLQVNYQPSDTIELVGQASASRLSRDAKAGDFLDLAFASWRPDANWTLRLGRINLDAYLISDHRDVGFTYQFMRPPVEFYSRMPSSLDGADISRTWSVGSRLWQAKLFVGRTSGGTGSSRLKLWPVVGLVASHESDGLLLRMSALHGRTTNNISALEPLFMGLQQMQAVPVPQVSADAAQMQSALTTDGMRTNYLAAAIAYDRHDWLLTAEINWTHTRHNPWISFTSGYLSAGRRFGAFSAVVTESGTKRNSSTFRAPDWATPLAPMGPMLAQQAQQIAFGATRAINNTAAEQSTTSFSLRWDVTPRVALKAQWDHIRWPEQGSALWANADGVKGSANVIGIAADFVF